MIELESLTKRYGDHLAVEELSLSVPEGEIFGFLGPNGAGKSTVINTLLGYISPTEGRATILGHDVTTESRLLREKVGVLPEGVSVYRRLTGREHVEMAIDMKNAADSVEDTLDRVGLTSEEASRRASNYSTGMRQRLGLGMALVGDPELLILDEPSSGLDPNGMREIRSVIRDESQSGTTVFLSTHLLGEIEAICDRVGIMNDGKLVAVDETDELRRRADVGQVLNVQLGEALEETSTAVGDIDGVTVTTHGDVLSVRGGSITERVEALQIADDRGTVRDFWTDEPSLEDVFSAYTGRSRTDSVPDQDDRPQTESSSDVPAGERTHGTPGDD